MAKPFKFKQFDIYQDKCAMKVGTDGVLLGAFANPAGKLNALDIGAGTGLLSLMLAQKDSDIRIQSIEIDDDAYKQAKYNIGISQWKSRVEVANISLQSFAALAQDKFDLIICNPPFFDVVNEAKGNNQQKITEQRKKARTTATLSFYDLIVSVNSLLSDDGEFYVVIPSDDELNFISMLNNQGLYVNEKMNMKSFADNEPVRVFIKASRTKTEPVISDMVVYQAPTKHTDLYIKFTSEFYLGTGKYF